MIEWWMREEGKSKSQQSIRISTQKLDIQGGFFDCSALKMTKCQPLKEISELFLPKND